MPLRGQRHVGILTSSTAFHQKYISTSGKFKSLIDTCPHTRRAAERWKKPSQHPSCSSPYFSSQVTRNKEAQLLITLGFTLWTNHLLGNDCSRSRFSPGTCLWPVWRPLSPPGISLQTEGEQELLRLFSTWHAAGLQDTPSWLGTHLKSINSV